MLHVHRAERTALLASGLADLLSRPLADPFAQEVVAVPAKGVERWLAQRLSTVLGAGAAAAVVVGAVPEMFGQDGAPRLVRALVDDLEQLPRR